MRTNPIPSKRAITITITLLMSSILLSGCRSMNPLRVFTRTLFTGASLQDLEIQGVARDCKPVTAALTAAALDDDRAEGIAVLAQLLGIADPIGCMLRVDLIGQDDPTFVFCGVQDGMEERCRKIPLNSMVRVSGKPEGPGGLIIPSRVTWQEE